MSVLPLAGRPDSLVRQIAARLLLAVLISGVLASGLGVWFYRYANDRVSEIRLQRVVDHYRNALADLELRWGREAFNLKSRLEFARILEPSGLHQARFRSFLVAQGGYLEFPLVVVSDRSGQVLFDYSPDNHKAPKVSFPEGGDAVWAFDERSRVLYRVFRQTVWVGNGNAVLALFRPVDNALLLRSSDPEATITALWNGEPVASAGGATALSELATDVPARHDERSSTIPWYADETGPQPRALLQLKPVQAITVGEMMMPLLAAGLAFVLIAWALLGRWMVATLQRFAALERGQQAFIGQRRLVDGVLEQLASADDGRRDEISRVAAALGTLMRDAETHERVLKESEYFFRESQRAAAIGSYKLDLLTGNWRSSEVLDQIFGIDGNFSRTVESWLGLLHPDDAGIVRKYFLEDVIGRRQSFDREYRIVRPSDGETRWVQGNGELAFDADGQIASLIGTVQDITARKQADERLALAGMVFDSAAEGIVVSDSDNNIILVNPAFENISGYRAAEVLGRNPRLLSSGRQGRDFYRAMWSELLERGHWKGELWNVRKDGRIYLQRTSIAIIADADGRPFRHVSLVYDVTAEWNKEQEINELNVSLERRVAERTQSLKESNRQLQETLETLGRAKNDLVRSEKLAALGALVAGVAHEMNTPIGNSLTVASTLGERTHEIHQCFASGNLKRSDLADYLDAADRAGEMLVHSMQRAHDLIVNFKQVAVDQTSENRREFDLAAIIEENLLVLRPGFKRLPYKIELKVPSGIEMNSYPGPLGQVISNIIANAMQHAFEGMTAGILSVAAEPDGGQVRLIIEDNGIGMDDAVRQHAFDPFFTTKFGKGGSGLGLHIVFNIVSGVLGGKIDLESTPGRGSRFVVTLPRTAPADAENHV